MFIKIKTLTGKELEINVELDDSIEKIKDLIEEKEGIPPIQQRLIFSGKQLHDKKNISDYKVQPNSVFHLILALRGGK